MTHRGLHSAMNLTLIVCVPQAAYDTRLALLTAAAGGFLRLYLQNFSGAMTGDASRLIQSLVVA